MSTPTGSSQPPAVRGERETSSSALQRFRNAIQLAAEATDRYLDKRSARSEALTYVCEELRLVPGDIRKLLESPDSLAIVGGNNQPNTHFVDALRTVLDTGKTPPTVAEVPVVLDPDRGAVIQTEELGKALIEAEIVIVTVGRVPRDASVESVQQFRTLLDNLGTKKLIVVLPFSQLLRRESAMPTLARRIGIHVDPNHIIVKEPGERLPGEEAGVVIHLGPPPVITALEIAQRMDKYTLTPQTEIAEKILSAVKTTDKGGRRERGQYAEPVVVRTLSDEIRTAFERSHPDLSEDQRTATEPIFRELTQGRLHDFWRKVEILESLGLTYLALERLSPGTIDQFTDVILDLMSLHTHGRALRDHWLWFEGRVEPHNPEIEQVGLVHEFAQQAQEIFSNGRVTEEQVLASEGQERVALENLRAAQDHYVSDASALFNWDLMRRLNNQFSVASAENKMRIDTPDNSRFIDLLTPFIDALAARGVNEESARYIIQEVISNISRYYLDQFKRAAERQFISLGQQRDRLAAFWSNIAEYYLGLKYRYPDLVIRLIPIPSLTGEDVSSTQREMIEELIFDQELRNREDLRDGTTREEAFWLQAYPEKDKAGVVYEMRTRPPLVSDDEVTGEWGVAEWDIIIQKLIQDDRPLEFICCEYRVDDSSGSFLSDYLPVRLPFDAVIYSKRVIREDGSSETELARDLNNGE